MEKFIDVSSTSKLNMYKEMREIDDFKLVFQNFFLNKSEILGF